MILRDKTHPRDVILYSTICFFATYNTFRENSSNFRHFHSIVACSSIAATIFNLYIVQKTRSWSKENVRWITGTLAFCIHGITLISFLGIRVLNQYFSLTVACLGATRVAYELTALRRDHYQAESSLHNSFQLKSSTNLQLSLCYHFAVRDAIHALTHEDERYNLFSEEDIKTQLGQPFTSTMGLATLFLLEKCVVNQTDDTITFIGKSEKDEVLETTISSSFFFMDGNLLFNIGDFFTLYAKLNPVGKKLLTRRITGAEINPHEIEQLGADWKKVVDPLFNMIFPACRILELKVLTPNSKLFSSIFTDKSESIISQ